MKWILMFLGITTPRSAKFLIFGCAAILTYWTFMFIKYDANVGHVIFYISISLAYILLFVGVYVGSWALFTERGKILLLEIQKEDKPKNNIKRFGKVLFACWGITVAGLMIITVGGLFLFGPNFITDLTDTYYVPILILLMVISFPFVNKKLR